MAEQPRGPTAFGELATAMTGASSHVDHDSPVGPPADVVIRTGHEADTFAVKSILMVPVAIALMAGIAYTVVTVAFEPVNRAEGVPAPAAGETAKRAMDRIAHISSTDPDAKVHQPRLEPIKVTDSTRKGKTDPEFVRSVRFSETGNSPEYYPEDLRAENYIDPATKQKVLRDYAWVLDKKVARIPVEAAMQLLVSEKMLPVRAKESKPGSGTVTVPKLSNGGWGLPAEKAEPAKADAKDGKKDDHK
jgi:hypothetical protein